MSEKEQRLKELKDKASGMDDIPLGLKIAISKLESELYPDGDDGDCLMCGS